jgi:hypothetical protein
MDTSYKQLASCPPCAPITIFPAIFLQPPNHTAQKVASVPARTTKNHQITFFSSPSSPSAHYAQRYSCFTHLSEKVLKEPTSASPQTVARSAMFFLLFALLKLSVYYSKTTILSTLFS